MTPSTTDTIREALWANRKLHRRALDRLDGKTAATSSAKERHQAALDDIAAALDEVNLEAKRSAAVHDVIEYAVGWPGFGVVENLTCPEAMAFADMLTAYGRSASADALIEAHAWSDEDPEDEHHDRYLILNKKAG